MASPEEDAKKDEDFSIGPFADESGIDMRDLTNPVAGKLAVIKNGLVLEIVQNVPTQSSTEAADILTRLAHPDSSIHHSNSDSLRQKIATVVRTKKQKTRSKKSSVPAYLSREFVPPVLTPAPKPDATKRTYDELQTENDDMKQELQHIEEEQKELEKELQSVIQVAERLSDELAEVVKSHNFAIASHCKDIKKLSTEKTRLQNAYELKSNELDKVNVTVNTLRERSNAKSDKIKSLIKKVKRDTESNQKQLKQIKTLENTNKEMQREVDQKNECMKVAKEQMDSAVKDRRTALKDLCQVKRRAKESKCSLIAGNEAKIKELRQTVKQQDAQIRELEQLNELLEGNIIQTFEGGRFVNNLRETCMIFLTECNVSMSKLPKVINTVCKNLVGKLPDKLPSHGTLHRILTEAKFVAQTQIAECLEEGGDPAELQGNTLHSDATTKFHRHYQGFQATLKDGKQITIGLVEVGAGDSETYMDAFKSTISELAEAVSSNRVDQTIKIARLVTSLKNTMGDQGPTNPQFNLQLKTFREELLPSAVENWESLSAAAKDSIADMGNFFCKMHLFVNFATEADKVLKINEADVVAAGRNQFAFGHESGAARLVRTAAKALTTRGCDMAGMAANWLTFLSEQGITNHIILYRANRFNVLFYDAAATYFHRNHIHDFIAPLPEPNNLLKAVQFDVQQKVYLAQIRALGMIDKVITGPFWRVVESASNVLALNEHLNTMLHKMKSWTNDARSLLEGEQLFMDVDIHKDEVYHDLFAESEDSEFTTYTQVALEMVLTGMVLILERQAKDQLEGGKYFQPSEAVQKSTETVPTTNNVSERDFAVLDVLVRLKPAASCHSFETYILWLHNKPSEWLDNMNIEEKNNLLDMARGRYRSIREQYMKRKEKLKQQHRQALKAKQEKKENKEHRSRINKVAATDKIFEYGGVWTLDSYKDQINQLQPSKRSCAILSQLTYHKRVLNSKGNPKLFQKTLNGTNKTENTLCDNLKTVLELNEITAANVDQQNSTTAHLQYHTRDELQRNVETSKTKMFNKIKEQRNQIKAKQQQTLLPQLLQNPASLVGKKCKHKCREEDGTVEWFNATVSSICSIKLNVIKTDFKVVYDEFPDDTWNFPLLMDLKKGDLIIVD